MKPLIAVVLVLAGLFLLLLIGSCAAVLVGVHNGVCQNEPYASGCH